MPRLALIGMIVFAIGSVGPVYIGYRAKGWRSLFPFLGGGSTLKIYRDWVREKKASAWPLWLWFCCQPLGAVLVFCGILSLGRFSNH